MRTVILMDGGLVQSVLADMPDCEYAVIELDIEGGSPERLCLTPDGKQCLLTRALAEHEPDYTDQVFRTRPAQSLSPGVAVDLAVALSTVVASHDNWRHCSDVREALAVWSETVEKARSALAALSRP